MAYQHHVDTTMTDKEMAYHHHVLRVEVCYMKAKPVFSLVQTKYM